jgi:molybdopterin converting factor small subunit
MMLRVKYSAQLRTALQRREDVIDMPNGSALDALLVHLARTNEAARPHLLASNGQLHPSLLIVVNDAARPARDAGTCSLNDGDTVLLLPPIAGG